METPYAELIVNQTVLTDDTYYDDKEYVSQSSLSYIDKSSQHYTMYLHGQLGNYETAAMKFGTAFHHYVLEPETFDDTYAILDTDERPEPTRAMSLKANKEWKEEFMSSLNGRILLEKSDFNTIQKMCVELHRSVHMPKFFNGSSFEEIAVWKHKPTGIMCKGKIDIINREQGFIADLKTASSAHPDSFTETIISRKYHRQAAFYLDAFGLKDYYIIAIEKTFPFAYCIYRIKPETIDEGRKLYESALNKIKHVRTTQEQFFYNEEEIYEV